MAHSTFLLALLLVGVAVQASAQAPPEVTISYVVYQGSGCNYENTNYVLSNDYKMVTFIFGGMVATTDGLPAGKRKSCQMSFYINYPDGWSVSIGQATARWFADIAQDSAGIYEVHYYLSGQTGTAMIERKIQGPYTGSFEFTDDFRRLVWSECNNTPNLNIKMVVRVEGKKAVMGIDSVDCNPVLILNLQWKKCP
ncbi:hypothetical protein CBR_g9185 [Chara braunii]|uniref:DUF4360 domain-containing protein n=1 Tax=Chara braunii TaxID=69332 RepID=A0A388KNZ5_CHABU|nr:hypothetical protein CBR_g9185 [Chara braunii]|eukprot:GBG71776.1 hypothetical protein CBR_g9185 [Chara braunii]